MNKDKDFDTSKIKFELPELLVKFLEDKNVMSTQDDTRYFVDNVVYKEQNGWFSLITKPTNDPNVNKFIRECLQYRLEQFQEDKIDLDIADIVGLGWTFDVQEDGYYYFYIHDKESDCVDELIVDELNFDQLIITRNIPKYDKIPIFDGKIKNKSELKKLMQQLGIK